MSWWYSPAAEAFPDPMPNPLPKNWIDGRRSPRPRQSSPAEARIPRVLALDSFAAAVQRAVEADFAALFYENEHTRSMRSAVESRGFATAALMTGPEGGLTEQEVQAAQDAGMEVCSLGPRILRCETAPLCALSALMYAADELG